MKICPNCDSENRDDSKFCTSCSYNLQDVESEDERIAREERERKEREKLEEEERKLELERKKREEEERKLELERKKREEKERRKRERNSKLKKGAIVGLIIIILLLVVGIFLMSGLGDSINQDLNKGINLNDSNSNFNSNSDSVDEVISSQEEEVKMKKVDFNRLFNMYVPQDYDYSEYPPQYNSTYQWVDSNSYAPANIYYYDQSHDLNEIVSRLNEAYPGLQMVQDGNLIILTSDSGTNFVGVQSPNDEFVFIKGYDLDTGKACANSIVFE